jgi:alpha-maltose-1-phosphate synthase
MRVAHILRKYDPAEWGGTESAVLRLLDGLRKNGVESTVFAPRLARGVREDPLADAGFHVRRFEAVVPVWGISPEARRQMVAVGGNLVSFELMGALWGERGLDLVHSHALGRLGGIGLAVARRRGLPFAATIHGGVYDLPPKVHRDLHHAPVRGWEWGKLFGLLVRSRQMLDDADAIFTCNPREAELIRERHPGQRVRVQPHGVNADAYAVDRRAAARTAFPWADGAEVILIVGRLDTVKNPGWAIERLPAILERHPRAVLALAGACTEAGYQEKLQRRAAELGLGERVRFLGGLPAGDPRLIGLMQLARVMVLPSLSETFGLVILEAWAAGTPVLASRTSGATMLIADGADGVLFDLERPLAFDAALHTALTDESWRATAIAAGQRKVAAHYDTAAVAAQVKSVYEELIAERHPLRHSA